MTWLEKAKALEDDHSVVGTILFWDATVQAIKEELDYQRHLAKELSKEIYELRKMAGKPVGGA